MKEIGYREIRHIVANHTIMNRSTAYCRKSKSVSYKIVRKLMRDQWVECNSVVGPFVFVRPTKKLLVAFGNN